MSTTTYTHGTACVVIDSSTTDLFHGHAVLIVETISLNSIVWELVTQVLSHKRMCAQCGNKVSPL